MAKTDISIFVKLRDQYSQGLKGVVSKFNKASKSILRNWANIHFLLNDISKAFKFMGNTIYNLGIKSSASFEITNNKLSILLRSAEEGTKLFENLKTFALQAPQGFDEIAESASALAGVMKDGRTEIEEMIPLMSDLAAAYDMPLREVTSQIIRMYSAGAASADMFRERGITAMMGFKAGVSYTTEETMEILKRSWNKADSKFRGAAAKLAQTWHGMMGMLRDAWMQFTDSIGKAGVFDAAKNAVKSILDLLSQWKSDGTLDKIAKQISDLMMKLPQLAEGAALGIHTLYVEAVRNFKLLQLEFINVAIRFEETIGSIGWLGFDQKESQKNIQNMRKHTHAVIASLDEFVVKAAERAEMIKGGFDKVFGDMEKGAINNAEKQLDQVSTKAQQVATVYAGAMQNASSIVTNTIKKDMQSSATSYDTFAKSISSSFNELLASISSAMGSSSGGGFSWKGMLMSMASGVLTSGLGAIGGKVSQFASSWMNYGGARMNYAGGTGSSAAGHQLGTSYIGRTGNYMLHRGEAVMPAHKVAEGKAGGGGNTINIIQNIQAWDTRDVMRNKKNIAMAVADELRNNGGLRGVIKQYS